MNFRWRGFGYEFQTPCNNCQDQNRIQKRMFKIYDSYYINNTDEADGLQMYGKILSPEETQVFTLMLLDRE